MFFNNNFCCQGNNDYNNQDGFGCNPIIEPTQENCIERNICHKVEHICPIHTKIINNHIIEHVYRPEYSCSEENVITNIDPGCCGNFN